MVDGLAGKGFGRKPGAGYDALAMRVGVAGIGGLVAGHVLAIVYGLIAALHVSGTIELTPLRRESRQRDGGR